jgi:CubicO group peptidase (beta-lactamase class C family)
MHEQITSVVRNSIKEKVFPGCVFGYSIRGRKEVLPFGRLRYDEAAPDVTENTVYDVASITKSIPTSSLILKLIESGKLRLDDPVIKYLPEIDNEYRGEITIKHLLTYTVIFDLPKGIANLARENPSNVLEVLFTSPLVAPPGEKYYYTNAPAILLGLVAERVAGEKLEAMAQKTFFEPLGMNSTTFHPTNIKDVAPTEVLGGVEIRGVVHDETARIVEKSGKILGNAGLFSTVGDLMIFADMLLNKGELRSKRFFTADTIASMHENQLTGDYKTGLGWEMGQEKFMGKKISNEAFGKTGFTGCLILIDMKKEAALVHLSNRTYPSRPDNRDDVNVCRRQLADLVFGS